ncbi:DNA-binding transcriptional regulator, MocR family, contains an aminotransferase domain [Amycolatopsis lurida]|uniref:GntR family transcriptional regulator n=1 Tax=Amycolatopsis lurida NRRL 2430 TaxID=1460371 RepID=A0A2P2FL16_AMYLU|nr:PLP-dependent aminotransferase family protein [Amycolatopsis lurida]KFU77414.1 GntR family transcriptional regulator [Amycolatopsis lurida NRRL 2430]SEB36898.1 DNA-binding transcriptional regulator, MocR family, contains an aminotransferase domain [Amycolatopsis lurida]
MSDSSTSALVAQLRLFVRTAAAGERLPSSRELIERYRVGPGTVSRAIALLAAEGIVVTRPGSGTYVAKKPTGAGEPLDTAWQTVALTDRSVDTTSLTGALGPAPEDAILLDGGYPHRSLQASRFLGAALARAGRRPDAWDRAPAAGLTALRSVFAGPAGASPDDVLITAGGQSGLSMAFRAIAAPGSPVLVESPTYPGALAAARAAGLRPVPVPLDDEGVRPDLLAEAFAMTGARLFYCQPTFHNPTGTVLAAERRTRVLDVARAAGAFVLEDDFARHLSHGATTPRPLITDDRDGTVVHLTSVTKASAPSLRIGALIARGPVLDRMKAIRQVDDFFVARPLQEAALELLSAPSWERHVRRLGAELRERCAKAAAALAAKCPEWTIARLPEGGLHLWVRLPAGSDPNELARTARERGVVVGAGERFFATEPAGPFLRLSFAAAADIAELTEGIRRLDPSV